MTSQDEEEDDHERSGTDSANDTDATLVEDAPPRIHERLPTPPPPPPAALAPAYLPEELWPDYIRIWWEGRFAGVWDGFDSFPEHW